METELAIVLRAVPFEERHLIVTALTEKQGKISALAKNAVASRRMGAALQPFVAGEWHFRRPTPHADIVYLSSVDLKRAFTRIRQNLESVSIASAFTEILLKITPQGNPCEPLFRLHSNALAVLDEEGRSPEGEPGSAPPPHWRWILLNAFLAKALQWCGAVPQLLFCRGCEVPLDKTDPSASVNGSAPGAGWFCAECARAAQVVSRATAPSWPSDAGVFAGPGEAFPLSLGAIHDFYKSLSTPVRQMPGVALGSTQDHERLRAFLLALVAYHVPGFDRGPLKSLQLC